LVQKRKEQRAKDARRGGDKELPSSFITMAEVAEDLKVENNVPAAAENGSGENGSSGSGSGSSGGGAKTEPAAPKSEALEEDDEDEDLEEELEDDEEELEVNTPEREQALATEATFDKSVGRTGQIHFSHTTGSEL
jgi:hypothetical protein